MNKLLALPLILLLAACSNRAVYDNIQHNNRNACINEPPPLYQDCIARANKSYEEYEREKQ